MEDTAYIMNFKEHILINTTIYEMIKNIIWSSNMTLLIYSLKQNYYPWFENEKWGDKKESIDKEEFI